MSGAPMSGRRRAVGAIGACFLAGRVAAMAEDRVYRIGVLCDEQVPYFWQQLGALGYEDHRNVEYLQRGVDASADPDRYATRLVGARPNVIVACSNDLAAAAKRATTEIPIVLLYGVAPVEVGLVQSLARPGGNLTGSAAITVEMAGKSLELFKSAIPGLRRAVALLRTGDAVGRILHAGTQRMAGALGVSLTTIEVRDAGELSSAFDRLGRERPDGVIVSSSLGPLAYDVVGLAATQRIPTMYPFAPRVREGGLMAYAPNWIPQSENNARIVHRILQGEKPRDIPMQQPVEYFFGINLKTARALGLTIPRDVLLRATRIVE